MKNKRTTYEFERRQCTSDGQCIRHSFETLDAATTGMAHDQQVTFEEIEGASSYTHIVEYRNDGDGFEHYNDLYFISEEVLLECDNEKAGDE